jgi:hypothetical protein
MLHVAETDYIEGRRLHRGMAFSRGDKSNGVPTRPRRRLPRDASAQVSFSVIATVLLLSTVAAGGYLAKREMDELSADRHSRLLEEMEASVRDVVLELSLCAAARAQRIVSGWSEFPVNNTEVSSAFSDSMADYIGSSFPRAFSSFEQSVVNWTGGLFFVEMNTVGLATSDERNNSTIELEGASMEYSDVPPAGVEVPAEGSVTPYYLAVGNFTVEVSNGIDSVTSSESFDRAVISALPFIESQLRAFETATFGEMSDLGKLVSCMLTTLAQLRVLEGYGSPMYSNGLDTGGIVTPEDVFRATQVALLLEQARLFRDVDKDYADQVAEICLGGNLGLMALFGSVARYADAGELFLWFLGRTEHAIDPNMMVAHAVNGLVDQLVVKIMDYFGWLGVLDAADSVLRTVADSVDSLIAYLTGEDKAQTAVAEWIRGVMRSARINQEAYSELFSLPADCWAFVPERTYFVEDASGTLHPVWVGNCTVPIDLPTYDLTEAGTWADFYDEFREHQMTARDLVHDSIQRLAWDVATMTSYEIGTFVIDPFDGRDVFSTLAAVSGTVKLTPNQASLSEAVKNLPMFSSQYGMVVALSEFAWESLQSLFGDGLMDAAFSDLAATLLADARYPYVPELVVPVEQQLADIVRSDVEHDIAWGVPANVLDAVTYSERFHMRKFLDALNASVTVMEDGFAGPIVDGLATLLVEGSSEFPGLAELVEEALSASARALFAQQSFAGHKQTVYLDLGGEFDFWEGNLSSASEDGSIVTERLTVDIAGGMDPMTVVPFEEGAGDGGLCNLIPCDEMLVQVRCPWDFERDRSDYPNTHLTSIASASAAPYSTQWTVSVRGRLDITVTSESSTLETAYADDPATSNRSVGIDLCLPIVVHSPSPLAGVEYNPTNTFLSDAIAAARVFCDMVWEKLEPVVGWVKRGLDRVLWFLQDFFDVVNSFATRLIRCLATGLQSLVETLQEYILRFADSVLGEAVRLLIDLTGTIEVRISLYGFTITIQTNLPDLLFKDARDLLRVMVHTRLLGPGITFGVRVAKLSDGRHDLIVNGTLVTDDFTAEIVVDPLMQVKRRLVELHLVARTWRLDLAIPEVEPYDVAGVSTSDLPGVGAMLSNIPLPLLGLSASVELGMKVKYSPPFPTNVVVNEFEANPAGDDSGKEWVEVYNPLSRSVDLDGWSVETTHGGTCSMQLEGAVAPGGFAVFFFPDTSIDNGQAGEPFNDGDSLVLVDASGQVVDATPTLSDTANDARTHQRNWDGGPKWHLKTGTMADSNGVPVFLATSDYIAKALFEAVREAFDETKTVEVTASVEFLQLLGRRIIDNFIDNLLDIVKEVVHEVVFYIEVKLGDATGSASAGFRVSFVIKGEAIAELLKWLVKSLATYLVNLGRMGNPIEYPPSPDGFFANLHLRLEVFFSVGMPRMLAALGGRVDESIQISATASIAPNMPAIGRLFGRDWGAWSVDFGLCLEGVPREAVGSMMLKASGDLVDVWLVRARAYGV